MADRTERAAVGRIELAYETFGDTDAPPMLLIAGLATQMLGWDEQFCMQLADKGFHVIRFDNRDVGRSTHLDDAGVPNLRAMMRRPGEVGRAVHARGHGRRHRWAARRARARVRTHCRHVDGRHDRTTARDQPSAPRPKPDLDHVHPLACSGTGAPEGAAGAVPAPGDRPGGGRRNAPSRFTG